MAGCQLSTRASSARVTSTEDNLRARIAEATSTSDKVAGSNTACPSIRHDDEGSRLDLQLQNEVCLCKFPHSRSYRACHTCASGRIQRNAGTGSDRGNTFGGDIFSHAKLLTLL